MIENDTRIRKPRPLGRRGCQYHEWTTAIEKYQPWLTISGHDHHPPNELAWPLAEYVCINLGQGHQELHYGVIEIEFQNAQLQKIQIQAYPWAETLIIDTTSNDA